MAALDRCTLNKVAFAFKIVRGALKWPLKGGSHLIEVAATAGLTVLEIFVCVDALHPNQQSFSHVGMISCLPGLNQY